MCDELADSKKSKNVHCLDCAGRWFGPTRSLSVEDQCCASRTLETEVIKPVGAESLLTNSTLTTEDGPISINESTKLDPADSGIVKTYGLQVMANSDCSRQLNGTFLVQPKDRTTVPSCESPPGVNASSARTKGDFTATTLSRVRETIPQSTLTEAQLASGHAIRPEVMYEEGNLLPFHFLRAGDRIGRAVVKIQRDDGATGTGFLVASDILLTNHHVLPDLDTASVAVALANYEVNPPEDTAGRSTVAPLDPHSLFVTNPDLDFTFCGVRGLDFLGSVQLDRQQMHVEPEEIVNIIQHPRGRPKEVVLRDNWVVRADSVVLHYSCDTEPGSSGSPVFNNAWKPVALHHASVLTDSPEGRTISETDSGRYINEGIRLSAIALWLETAEANTRAKREQVARLRALFGGLNAKVGFFGALGRRSHGLTAPEVVADIYAGVSDSLDIGYWDTQSLEGIPRDRIAEVAQVMAEMGLDLWCFTNIDDPAAESLCHLLRAGHRLDYAWVRTSNESENSPLILYRKHKDVRLDAVPPPLLPFDGLMQAPLDPATEAAVFVDSTQDFEQTPPGTSRVASGKTRIQFRRKNGEMATIHCAIVHSKSDLKALNSEVEGRDWLILGDAATLLANESQSLLDRVPNSLTAACGHSVEYAMIWIPSPGTSVEALFTTPNLYPTVGPTDTIHPARDRPLPAGLRAFNGSQPIAIRLMLAEPKQALDLDGRSAAREEDPSDQLERRLREALEPMLSKLIAELRGKLR